MSGSIENIKTYFLLMLLGIKLKVLVIIELECIVIIFGVKQFKSYLWKNMFKINIYNLRSYLI